MTEHLGAPTALPAPFEQPVGTRAGWRWWTVAAVAVAAGTLSGISASCLARPSTAASGPASGPTAGPAGVFDKGTATPAPGWSLPDLRNPSGVVSLAQFAGRPVVINFWASWCPPCRKEMPALASQARQLTGRVAFVGVDTSDQRGPAVAFAAQSGVTYPLAFDPRAGVADRYGSYGLPTTIFVSAAGQIVGRQVGGMTSTRLAQLLEQTFDVGGKSPLSPPLSP